MGLTYLMDSNTIIDYAGKKYPKEVELKLDVIFDDIFYYSIITFIEVMGFNADPVTLQDLQDFLRLGHQYYVSDDIANETILIRRSLPKIKTPDAIIAATAIVHHHTLLTRNIGDFKNITDLKIIAPYTF